MDKSAGTKSAMNTDGNTENIEPTHTKNQYSKTLENMNHDKPPKMTADIDTTPDGTSEAVPICSNACKQSKFRNTSNSSKATTNMNAES